jgi:hypothetical protein
MSKQIQTISFFAFVARVLPLVLLIGMHAAEAKECSAAQPSNPQGHWSYRLIDGRKCWYQGENNFPKSLLQWPEQTSALSAFGKAEPSPEEELLRPVPQTGSPYTEFNNQSDSESFEARWRALGMTLLRN